MLSFFHHRNLIFNSGFLVREFVVGLFTLCLLMCLITDTILNSELSDFSKSDQISVNDLNPGKDLFCLANPSFHF